MPVVSLGPDVWDDEIDTLVRLLRRGGWRAHEIAQIERAITDRAAQIRAGLTSPTARYWTDKIQRELDDRTRMRWDFTLGWTLDRWAQGRWVVVGALGFHHIRPDLIQYLREHDMQRWASPQAYLEHKRELAAKRRAEVDYENDQKLLTVVDKMSAKQIQEFLQVEAALKSGDTVTLRGASRRMWNRMAAASRNSPPPPSGRSINPGHRPF